MKHDLTYVVVEMRGPVGFQQLPVAPECPHETLRRVGYMAWECPVCGFEIFQSEFRD